MMLAGAILTAIGILALVFQTGIHYNSRQRLPHNAKTQVVAEQEKVLSISPLLSGLALAGGITVMILAARR
jgi:hypothetical protein